MFLPEFLLIALCVTSVVVIFHLVTLFNGGALLISRLRISLAVCLPLIISISAYKRKSLDFFGSIAAFFVGALMTFHSYALVSAMITFFVTSTLFTKFRKERKRKLENGSSEGRDWKQVVANGGAAALFSMLACIGNEDGLLGGERRLRMLDLKGRRDFERMVWYDLAILGSIASAAGDTWASEIGAAVGVDEPRLIVSLRKVPRGTNGAVSFFGTLASVFGGATVGYAYWLTILLTTPNVDNNSPQWIFVIACALSGFFGSLIDSLLGATFQYSGFGTKSGHVVQQPGPDVQHISGFPILDNNDVNLLTSLISCLIAPSLARFSYVYIF